LRRRGGDDGGRLPPPEGGRDGAARGALRVGAGRAAGADRVGADRGGDTLRGCELGGETVRVGARRSSVPLDGRLVLPDPTVPCVDRAPERAPLVLGIASSTRRGVSCRRPPGVVVGVPVVRRFPFVPGCAVGVVGTAVRPRVTSPVTGVPVEGITLRPSAAVASCRVGLVARASASAARRRPLIVGRTVDWPEAPAGRRASSVPVPLRGVLVEYGDDAAVVRRPALRAGELADAA